MSYSSPVGDLRSSLGNHRWCAAAIIALALWIRLIVPAGFMPVFAGGVFHVELCSGRGVEPMPAAMPGMRHDRGGHDMSGKDDRPCGFSGHAPASMAGADPILVVLAIAFIVATTFRMHTTQRAPRRGFLRPQPRGPPAIG